MKILRCILVLALMALSVPALAGADTRTPVNRSDSSVSNVTAETLMAANKSRRFLFVQNIGATTVWISLTGTAAVSTAGSFKLVAGASLTFESETLTRGAVSIISETSTGVVTAYEG